MGGLAAAQQTGPAQDTDRQTKFPQLRVAGTLLEGRPENQSAFIVKQCEKVFDDATWRIGQANPELLKLMSRPGLQIVITDDIHGRLERQFGERNDPNEPIAAATKTTVDPATGKATGTTIFISEELFRGVDPGSDKGAHRPYSAAVARVITALDHELQHCARPDDPPVGFAVPTPARTPAERAKHETQEEIAVYTASIRDLEKIQETIRPKTGNEQFTMADYYKEFSGVLEGQRRQLARYEKELSEAKFGGLTVPAR
ncbi:MAG: hypothetical protein U0136_12075 [Bdellovibrionota bacterium]